MAQPGEPTKKNDSMGEPRTSFRSRSNCERLIRTTIRFLCKLHAGIELICDKTRCLCAHGERNIETFPKTKISIYLHELPRNCVFFGSSCFHEQNVYWSKETKKTSLVLLRLLFYVVNFYSDIIMRLEHLDSYYLVKVYPFLLRRKNCSQL